MFELTDNESRFYSTLRTSLSPEERVVEAAQHPELRAIMISRKEKKPLPPEIDPVIALEKVRHIYGLNTTEFNEATDMCSTLVEESRLNG